MNEGNRCAELREVLEGPGGLLRYPDPTAVVDSFTAVEECIADGLTEALESEDWGRFERYVFAATRHPDARYVAPLCTVLQRRLSTVNSDDIVIALGEIADPGSVPCLIEAMWWNPDWDEFQQLARKCVWALGRIGSGEAFAALRNAAVVGSDLLREEAERVIAGRR